jgi:hypothetical protein
MPENEKWVITHGNTPSGEPINSNLLIPTFIGISSNGEKLATPYQQNVRKALWTQVEGTVGALFSGNEKSISFSIDAEKETYISKLLNRDFIYFDLYEELPSAVFFPLVAKNYENKSNDHVSYVSSLFMLADNNGNLYGVAFDSKGNITELYPKGNTVFNKEQLLAYTNKAELIPFDFELVDEIPVAVFSKSFEMNQAVISNIPAELSADSDYVKNILHSFSFNPNNTNFYTMPDGSVSYVENSGEIKIAKDGNIYFTAVDKGIPLSEFLGYYPDLNDTGAYSFTDIIYAVKLLINSFDTTLFGGDAFPGITSVAYNDKTKILEITLRYFVGGIELNYEDNSEMVLDFIENNLVSAHLKTLSCKISEPAKKDISQKSSFAIVRNDVTSINFLSFSPTYVKNNADDSGTTYLPVWTLRTADKEE